ncbi:hypothetical protein ACVGOW_25830 [Pseudonocardia saturnea]
MRCVALDEGAAGSAFPFDLPVVDGLRRARLTLGPGVTFLVGENGSGSRRRSRASPGRPGSPPRAGRGRFTFATRCSESALGRALRVGRAPGRERSSFFLRDPHP